MRLCFDLDKTLCSGYPYEQAVPMPGAQAMLKQLREDGHTIIIYTARGMNRAASNAARAITEVGLLTLLQLKEWDFVYDEIYFGKPDADLYIDDKAVPVLNYEEIIALVSRADVHESTDIVLSKIDDLLNR